MLSWGSIWRSGQSPSPAASHVPPPKRSNVVRTRTQHVEIIGGGAPPRQPGLHRPRRHRGPTQQELGPPRLPSELITHIVLLAALIILEKDDDEERQVLPRRQRRRQVLELARVDRQAHRAILTNIMLPQVNLYGVAQVEAFAKQLHCNSLAIQSCARRVRRIHVFRTPSHTSSSSSSSVSAGGSSERTSLYSDIMAAMQFEKATMAPLQTILSHCTEVRHLSMDCTARVLDTRSDGEPGGLSMQAINLAHTRSKLEELDTLQSVYGGDLNEKLWELPSNTIAPCWTNLTHLQLHGPRFRMTASTALSLSQLPNLTHLALIMPLIVSPSSSPSPSSSSPSPDLPESQLYRRATDQLGRPSVLQLLVNLLGERLETLLIVVHDVEGYVGNVTGIAPWIHALYQSRPQSAWRPDDDDLRRTRVQLVTASARSLDGAGQAARALVDVHPTTFSKWMLERARRGRQWTFKQYDREEEGIAFADIAISYEEEHWTMPIEWVREEGALNGEHNANRSDEENATREANAGDGANIDEVTDDLEGTTSLEDDDEWGIDNLD